MLMLFYMVFKAWVVHW